MRSTVRPLFVLLLVAGVAAVPHANTRHVRIHAKTMMRAIQQDIELRPGESSRLGSSEQTLVFEAVEEDGRCPTGVTCVWEGDAVVRLSAGATGAGRAAIRLHTHADRVREAEHAGFVVRLVALTPYPSADRRIDPKDYTVRLRVTAKP